MLRQVFVIQKNDIVYQRMYANALSIKELDDLLFKIKRIQDSKIHVKTSIGGAKW